jgi:hypothetical protein
VPRCWWALVLWVVCAAWSGSMTQVLQLVPTTKTGEVHLSLQAICKRQKLPLIHCVESAGANLLAVPD